MLYNAIPNLKACFTKKLPKKLEKEPSFVSDNNLQVIIIIEVDIEETPIIEIKVYLMLHYTLETIVTHLIMTKLI
jgi:hypothetical protein